MLGYDTIGGTARPIVMQSRDMDLGSRMIEQGFGSPLVTINTKEQPDGSSRVRP
jgi:hypothetical protein